MKAFAKWLGTLVSLPFLIMGVMILGALETFKWIGLALVSLILEGMEPKNKKDKK